MKKKNVVFLNTEEIENITADSITGNAVERTRYNDLISMIAILTAEKKAYDKAIIEKHGHKTYKDNNTSISCYDSFLFNTEEFINDFGEETYKKYKTKKSHTEKVVKY